jgi:hypothetical protein
MSDEIWWSPTFKNDAKEILILPLDGAQLTINRTLTSALTPTPAVGITESITPSLAVRPARPRSQRTAAPTAGR